MKILLLSLIVTFSGFSSQAKLNFLDEPTEAALQEVRDTYDSLFLSMNGVSAVSSTACESESGKDFSEIPESEWNTKKFEVCMSVMAHNERAFEAVLLLFPLGARIDGVLLNVINLGGSTLELK